MIAQMLGAVQFFKLLAKTHLEQLGAIMEVSYLPTHAHLPRRRPRRSLYILVAGKVEMYRRSRGAAVSMEDRDALEHPDHQPVIAAASQRVATYTNHSQRRGFELAMWNDRPRAAQPSQRNRRSS